LLNRAVGKIKVNDLDALVFNDPCPVHNFTPHISAIISAIYNKYDTDINQNTGHTVKQLGKEKDKYF
jgi:hypothetical protein